MVPPCVIANDPKEGGVNMEKNAFRKTISKFKPKEQDCCSIEIEEKQDHQQETDGKAKESDCCSTESEKREN